MTSTSRPGPALKAARSKGEAKADLTDRAAWAIIDTENARRAAKTARLRQARAEVEATPAPDEAPAPKPKTQKAARPRRTRFSF